MCFLDGSFELPYLFVFQVVLLIAIDNVVDKWALLGQELAGYVYRLGMIGLTLPI